ncbi:efflux RND transporter periplasmic adaptor subunit [Tabrizicola sp.]|uniref:efflux RND transporter periplasmic adaptor subunit n=1 Tax=Tabrizicola sp. TaxID=2005166 RepID=UPI003D2CAF90
MRMLPALCLATLLTLPTAPLWAEAATDTPAAIPAPHITVATVQTRNLRDIVIASGLIGAVEQVQVAPLVEGQPIEALLADVGDLVTEGQVLARLSTSSLTLQKAQLTASLAAARAVIPQAQAQADEAQRVADRTQSLLAQGTSSQANADKANAAAIGAAQSLEAARANLALVEAQLANVELMLARTEVKAPVAGEITARSAQVGAIASAAMPMFSMIRDNALELRADVAEGDVLRLAPGQPVTLHLVGDTGPRKGTVRLVEPAIDTTTRMGRVRITIDDAAGVRPGMYAMAEVLVAERETAAAPITALGVAQGGQTALKVTGDTARLVAVTTGIRDAGFVEILTGLAPGDQIVAKAGAFVRDGDRITPVAAQE